jgi:hypothetical protein
MIVLVDTNVVFDVIEKRQPHFSASNQILCLCRRKALLGAVAFHTVANVFYQYGKAAAPFLRDRLLEDFSVHGASSAILDVLRWGLTDLEDACRLLRPRLRAPAISSHAIQGFQIFPRACTEPF